MTIRNWPQKSSYWFWNTVYKLQKGVVIKLPIFTWQLRVLSWISPTLYFITLLFFELFVRSGMESNIFVARTIFLSCLKPLLQKEDSLLSVENIVSNSHNQIRRDSRTTTENREIELISRWNDPNRWMGVSLYLLLGQLKKQLTIKHNF